eukprot:6203941-Pleurochrysis_carterae.AAC.2
MSLVSQLQNRILGYQSCSRPHVRHIQCRPFLGLGCRLQACRRVHSWLFLIFIPPPAVYFVTNCNPESSPPYLFSVPSPRKLTAASCRAQAVTNAEYRAFRKATKYRSDAEKYGWSFVLELHATEQVLRMIDDTARARTTRYSDACMHVRALGLAPRSS